MKDKIKNVVNSIIDYISTNEFKNIVIVMLLALLFITVFWSVMCTLVANDIAEIASNQKEENIKLQVRYDNILLEYARMKSIYEDINGECYE